MQTKTFTRPYTVKFRDSDPAGIAYFAHVFSWAHDSFEEFLPAAGLEWKSWFQNQKQVVPIKHTESEFKKPFRAGDTYDILVNVSRLGESSFTMRYQFLNQDRAAIHAEVLMTHVFLESNTFEKTSIPENIREILKAYLLQGSTL